MSVLEKREAALNNFRRAAALTMSVGNRKVYHVGGKGFSMEEVEEEMKRDPPTELGLSLIRVFSKSLEAVQAQIAQAQASLSSR